MDAVRLGTLLLGIVMAMFECRELSWNVYIRRQSFISVLLTEAMMGLKGLGSDVAVSLHRGAVAGREA